MTPPTGTQEPKMNKYQKYLNETDDGRQNTHYEGCWKVHDRCAIGEAARLADALERALQEATARKEPAAWLEQFKGFTPGPWRVFKAGGIIEIQEANKPDTAPAVVFWGGFDRSDKPRKEHEANAELIAAAPKLLAELKSLYAAPPRKEGWIPVSERLPEPDVAVYLWPEEARGSYIEEFTYKGRVYPAGFYLDTDQKPRQDVTHWMPLPAPPGSEVRKQEQQPQQPGEQL